MGQGGSYFPQPRFRTAGSADELPESTGLIGCSSRATSKSPYPRESLSTTTLPAKER
jgi:hypothetical protein